MQPNKDGYKPVKMQSKQKRLLTIKNISMNLVESMKREGCKELYSDFFASILDVANVESWTNFGKYSMYPFILIEDNEITDCFQSLNDALTFYLSDK